MKVFNHLLFSMVKTCRHIQSVTKGRSFILMGHKTKILENTALLVLKTCMLGIKGNTPAAGFKQSTGLKNRVSL